MKYNILEYSQEEVLKLRKTIKDKNDKEKEIRIDIIDLHILHLLSDFMNRKKIIKYIVNDKTYFSVQYKVFLEDLPILDIKQQALTDRLDKLAMFGLIEKIIIKNQLGSYSAFRLGEKYEDIKYFSNGSDIRVQTYQTTSANVANYEPKDYSTNNYSTNNNNKEIKDKSFIKKVAKINWRGDYAIYKDEVYKARDLLLEDDDYKAKITKLYPNIDYHRSILKSVMFWESEKGWECKKKSQSNNIDMVATIKKNIDKNVVFQNKNNIPIENEKLLDMEIQDEDGNLGDGTFFKNGRRWYYSNKEKRVCSINIKASPRPSEDFEYDSVKDIWYIPKGTDRNPKLDSLLW